MTTTSELTIPGVVISATGGSVLGAVVLYYIGVQLSVERLERIIDKWGHILSVTKEDIKKADRWFDKYGPWTVFFCRFIPLIRSLISIPAGMSKMNVLLFLGLTTLGTLIWNIVLVYLGAAVGNSWEDIVGYMDIYSSIVYVLIGIGVIVLAVIYFRRRKSYNN